MSLSYKNPFKLDFLEQRMLLSAGTDTGSSDSHSDDGKKEKKHHKSLFSSFGKALKKAAGAVTDKFDDKPSEKNTDKKQTVVSEDTASKVLPVSHVEATDVDSGSFDHATAAFLKLVSGDDKTGLSMTGLLSKIETGGGAQIASEALGLVEKFTSLGGKHGESKVLDVVNHLVKMPSALQSLVTVVGKAGEALGSAETQKAKMASMVAGIEEDSSNVFTFVLGLAKDPSQLTHLTALIEAGAASLGEEAVKLGTSVSSVFGNSNGILDVVKHITDHPEALHDPKIQALIENLSASMEQAEKMLLDYSNLSPELQVKALEDAQSFGKEIEDAMKRVNISDPATLAAVSPQVKPVDNDLKNSTSSADGSVDGSEEQAPVKKKTKNPVKRVVHYTEKYIAKPIIEDVVKLEHAIEKKIFGAVHSIEKKATKLKNHLKEFASSDEKLHFIAHDVKSVAKKIDHKAHAIFDAVNPTKENRSIWEHKLADLTRSTASLTVKFAHFFDDHLNYTPKVAKIAQYAQLLTMAVSKTILVAAGVAGVAATAYPPAVMISLGLVLASRGLDLAGDLIPLTLQGVDHLAHLNAKLVDYGSGRVNNFADLIDKRADHLHDRAMQEKTPVDDVFIDDIKVAFNEHNVLGFLAEEIHEELQETHEDIQDAVGAMEFGLHNVTLDISESIQAINRTELRQDIIKTGDLLMQAADAAGEALGIAGEGLGIAGIHGADGFIAKASGIADKIETMAPQVTPQVADKVDSVLTVTQKTAQTIADVVESRGLIAGIETTGFNIKEKFAGVSALLQLGALADPSSIMKGVEAALGGDLDQLSSALTAQGLDKESSIIGEAKTLVGNLVQALPLVLNTGGAASATSLIANVQGLLNGKLSSVSDVVRTLIVAKDLATGTIATVEGALNSQLVDDDATTVIAA